jgi:hypothetical protein
MDRLTQNQALNVNDQLVSNNGRVILVMQGDGNLVLYRTDDGHALWASNTLGKPANHAVMQGDGNFVVYSQGGQPFWATATDGHPGAWIVLQDDGNLVVYDNVNRALWASNTVQNFGPSFVRGFLPSTNAPLFHNGPWPAGTAVSISIFGLPPVNIDATGMGLCGGMSFLTRDIFESGTPQLRGTASNQIPLALADYLVNRLIQSFNGPATVSRWLSVTQALDHDTVVWGAGLFHQTVNEVPAILADIDAGKLCPIGIVLVQSYAAWDVFNNHVVLVWGYERHGDIMTLHTYDCNFQGRDDIHISLDISSTTPAKTITTNGTDSAISGQIRGFFRLPYTHADPSPAYIDDATVTASMAPPTSLTTGAQASVRLNAANTGSTTWTPALSYRLGSQAPQDNSNWGTNRVNLQQASVDPGQTASFQFNITAPAAAGNYAFSWQMVRELVHWFGQGSPSISVAVGSPADTCAQLHQRHADLVAQLQNVRNEIANIDWRNAVQARILAIMLNRQAQTIQSQLTAIEGQQHANGCAQG